MVRQLVVPACLLGMSLPALATSTLTVGADRFDATPVKPPHKMGPLCWPTQYSRVGRTDIISDYKGHRFLFNKGDGWKSSHVTLKGAHTIYPAPWGGYITADTESNAILSLDSLTADRPKSISNINGKALNRPHDLVIDPVSKYVYLLDGSRRLIRFKSLSGPFEEMSFPFADMNYARSLSLMEDHVYVANSSRGSMIRIDDFAHAKYTIIHSRRNENDYAAGAYGLSGLVLNSVTKANGRYFATNYFTTSYAQGKDPDAMRLISWRSWKDFQRGRFEDLSHLIPRGRVPYTVSVSGRRLMLTYFNHEKPCDGDGAMVIDMRLPLDNAVN
ncbi:hypothetical protein GCM10009552_15290 [Rothia nasimurium]